LSPNINIDDQPVQQVLVTSTCCLRVADSDLQLPVSDKYLDLWVTIPTGFLMDQPTCTHRFQILMLSLIQLYNLKFVF